MPEFYDIEFQRQTEELLGGTRVREVMQVGFTTKPHDVYAEIQIDLASWGVGGVQSAVGLAAENIESVAAFQHVAGLNYIQDINAVGNLVDLIEVYVVSTSGRSTAILRYPADGVSPTLVAPEVNALWEELDASEQ